MAVGAGPPPSTRYTPVADRDPWERQPGETRGAYTAFTAFLDLGPEQRTLPNAAAVVHKGVPSLKRWSQRWGWRRRVLAWEAKLEREALDLKRKAAMVAAEEAAKRHANAVKMLFGFAMPELSKVLNLIQRNTAATKRRRIALQQKLEQATDQEARAAIEEQLHDLVDMPLTDRFGQVDVNALRAFLETGVKLERLILGEPNEIVEERPATWVDIVTSVDDEDAGGDGDDSL